MKQGRFVSYIYRYNRDDERCENAGFVKVNRMSRAGDKCRIHIGIKDHKRRPRAFCTVYLFRISDGAGAAGEQFAELMLINGNGELEKDISWNDATGAGVPLDGYDGMLIRCFDGDIYCTRWSDREVSPSGIDISVKYDAGDAAERESDVAVADGTYESKSGVTATDGADEKVEISNAETMPAEENYAADSAEVMPAEGTNDSIRADMEIEAAERETACERMMRIYPRLPLLSDNRFIECVRIEPRDIGSMNMANWKLGTNSFLSHGYHNYRYLMLGKLLFGGKEERYVIGVPGVYSNKEKYLANMFGFTVFIPVKNTRTMTGKFGYWIVEVVE